MNEHTIIRSPAGPGTARTILAVNIVLTDRAVIENALTQAGHTITFTPAGTAASLIERGVYDFILIDVAEDAESGLKIASYVRNELQAEDMPIVVLAGPAVGQQVGAFFAAGVDDFIPRPFTENLLCESISQSINDDPFAMDFQEPGVSKPFNAARLDELISYMGREQTADIICNFLDEAETKITVLKNCLPDRELLSRELHMFISTAANIGLDHLAATCTDLKNNCHNYSEERIRTILKTMEADFRHGITLLTRYLTENGL